MQQLRSAGDTPSKVSQFPVFVPPSHNHNRYHTSGFCFCCRSSVSAHEGTGDAHETFALSSCDSLHSQPPDKDGIVDSLFAPVQDSLLRCTSACHPAIRVKFSLRVFRYYTMPSGCVTVVASFDLRAFRRTPFCETLFLFWILPLSGRFVETRTVALHPMRSNLAPRICASQHCYAI